MPIENLHIKKIKVDSYKSLKESEIELESGLNIIIGVNGAGKSNILQFIYRFAGRSIFNISPRAFITNYDTTIEYILDGDVHTFSYSLERIKKADSSSETSFVYELNLSKYINSKKILGDQLNIIGSRRRNDILRDDSRYTEFNILRNFRRKYITFGTPRDTYWISKPNRFVVDESNNVTFDGSFSEIGFLLDLEFDIEFELFDAISTRTKKSPTLLKNYLIRYLNKYLEETKISSSLKSYSPIDEIRFNPNINIYHSDETTIVENLYLEFLINNDWMPWSYLSDGTKRLFYLIAECLSVTKGVVLVEEPELGIHPHQLMKVLEFLNSQSQKKQIIISTHSPLVLDVLKEDELKRIVIASYDRGTKFRKLTKSEISKAKKYMNEVGELSYYWLHSDLEK